MKKIRKIIQVSVLLITPFIIAGCEADILEQPPGDAVTAEEFFNTGADLEAYTNDLYAVLPTKSVYIDDSDSDNILGVSAGERLRGARIVPTDRGSGGWSWGHLRRINYFLENYNRVDDAAATAQYSGIVRFFRAYFYFEKVKRFGAVPWYSEVINQEDEELLTKARDSRELVMDSIMADIDYAIENIPAEKELNYITKYTALILKARITKEHSENIMAWMIMKDL